MKKFNFKLKQILEIRKLKEEEELNKLYLIQRRYGEHSNLYDSYSAEKINALDNFNNYEWGNAGFGKYLNFTEYLKKLEYEMENEKRTMQEIQIEIDEQQVFVRDAKQKRMVIDKLKDKAYSEYRNQMYKMQQVEHDEIATMIFMKTRQSNGL